MRGVQMFVKISKDAVINTDSILYIEKYYNNNKWLIMFKDNVLLKISNEEYSKLIKSIYQIKR